MFCDASLRIAALTLLLPLWQTAEAGKPRANVCSAVDTYFAEQVWAKVGERTCLKCHASNGDARDSKFVLKRTLGNPRALSHNCAAFLRMAKAQSGGKSRLLVKATGGLDHAGGAVLKPGSTGYRILRKYVRRVGARGKAPKKSELVNYDTKSFFKGVRMISDWRLLRRITLSLAGRLPTEKERAAVKQGGLPAIHGILDRVMKEDAFYERLKEGFNDIFLTSFRANGLEVLSYNHFNKTRLWYKTHDLSHIKKKERQRSRWNLADVYRQAIRREPLELIAYIVRNDRPFTELVTADYIMVSPYSSRGYGVFEKVRKLFKDPDDPFEYVPTKLRALKSRNGKVQESKTGDYPHAGFLSMFHYLRRSPTTETNRNRLRARMYYRHFLGVDVMALAPQVTDAAAVVAKYEVPTMQAADCVVCHRTVDPLAGLFQDYNKDGHLGPRKKGWYTDMFGPGFEGTALPKAERWRAMQWLGERTAKDPRFATAMVEHVYYILFGRKVLKAPEDIDEPFFNAKRHAYQRQRELVEEIAGQFVKHKFNLKVVFKALVASDFYRADGLAMAAKDPRRQAELQDVGLALLLSPEQLERKIKALFGQKWGRLDQRRSKFKILYGGIDSHAVTVRMTEPSGAMGAIQRIMANDVACKNVVLDFSKKPSERRLFPNIELNVLPTAGPKAEAQIRQAIVHLHRHLLGREHSAKHREVERTYRLFKGIIEEAKKTKGLEKQASYFCGRVNKKRVTDVHYTLRGWRAVVTYLLRQHEFLYE